MNSNSINDKCPEPGKKYKFGGFTFIIPDPNFVMPEYFRSTNYDDRTVNIEQIYENNKNEMIDSENCNSNNVINNVGCDLYYSLMILFQNKGLNAKSVSSTTEVVTIPKDLEAEVLPVFHTFKDVSDEDVPIFRNFAETAITDVTSNAENNISDFILLDDSFEEDLDINDFAVDNKKLSQNDEAVEDEEMDWDYGNREDMHGKFRGFLVDDGEEYQDESKHLSSITINKMYEALRNVFGHDDFRHRQKSAITASLSGKDVFILMPTGAGKSLCYQLPAVLEDGLTVVISPLRALIDDQYDKMNQIGIKTEKLTSDVNQSKATKIYEILTNFDGSIKLLYVTPEKIAADPRFINLLKELHQKKKLSRFVIDEVHCVSQWGHDFRPDYTKLKTLRETFDYPRVPIIALTATATPKIVTDTKRLLKIESSKLFISTFVRPNLKYDVVDKSLGNTKKLLEGLFKTYRTGSGIVFCFSKNDCTNAKNLIESLGETAVIYHAGLNDKQRREAQQIWMSGGVRVVCATIAFGMGIDKPDVRFVVHMSMPKSIESYYQESGRAGRDGLPSHCCILYSYTDCIKLRKFVEDPIDNGTKIVKSDAVKKMQHANINEMIEYCECVSGCQRKLLVEHFGEIYDSGDCKADQTTCCRNCSKTRNVSFNLYEMTEMVTLIFQSIKIMSLTVKQLSDCLRGKVKIDGGNRGQNIGKLPMYNKGRFLKDTDACRLIIKLITDGFAYENIREVKFGRNNTTVVGYVVLSEEGEKFVVSNCKPKFYIHMLPVKFKSDDDLNKHFMVKVDVKEAEVVKEKFKSKHKEVYQCAKFKIQSLRTQIAKEERLLNPKEILTDEAVDQIAALLPRTNTELLSIDNMSRLKIKKYGGRIMASLNEFWRMIDKNDQVKMIRELDMFLIENAYQSPAILNPPSTSNRKSKTNYKRGKSFGGVRKNNNVARNGNRSFTSSSARGRRRTRSP
uniref:ATP-dependent DNA helicase n=1 Tax=Strongyloides venezuelensis TaxID=75913 RepID=A0A0K0F5E0_STRVS